MAHSLTKPKEQSFHPITIIKSAPPTIEVTSLSAREELEIYKREYARLTKENSLLHMHLAKATQEKEILESKYNSIHVHLNPIGKGSNDDGHKRVRRTANQIPRQFNCHSQNCGKSYGTEASLVQHIKLKHPLYFTSKEYEINIANLRKKTKSPLLSPSNEIDNTQDKHPIQDQQSTRIQDNIEKIE